VKKINSLINLTEFFSKRKTVSEALKEEIRALRAKLEGEEKSTILFSLSMKDTIVNLGEEIREVFDYQFHKYPVDGLSLLAIEIENVSVLNSNFTFNNYMQLKFKTSDENWNGSTPFMKTFCDDARLRIVDNSMGICYQPRFQSKKKYLEAKQFIQSVQKQLEELRD
jgi:hypothetical protein